MQIAQVGLKSRLFHGNPQLEAAAVSDPAHIVEGSSGAHVRKIQTALNILDGAGVRVDGVFGPATAAAVLAYKRKRSIINRSYQTSADSIVGKMTVARLDEELLTFELSPIVVKPILPTEQVPRERSSSRLSLNFSFSADIAGLGNIALGPSSRVPTFPQVIIRPGGVGSLRVLGGAGGRLRVTGGGGASTPIKLTNVNTIATPSGDEVDIDTNDKVFNYSAATMCGQSAVNVLHPAKLFAGLSILTLTDEIKTSTAATPPPEPNSKTKLISEGGTPLSPKGGKCINIFGEGESAGFSDYSSDIRHCSTKHAEVLHRPWTGDPRVGIGLDTGSIDNICCRGSPISPITVDEIRRIAKPGCRVSFSGHPDQIKNLLAGLNVGKTDDDGVHADLSAHSFVIFSL